MWSVARRPAIDALTIAPKGQRNSQAKLLGVMLTLALSGRRAEAQERPAAAKADFGSYNFIIPETSLGEAKPPAPPRAMHRRRIHVLVRRCRRSSRRIQILGRGGRYPDIRGIAGEFCPSAAFRRVWATDRISARADRRRSATHVILQSSPWFAAFSVISE
jgi:hypothetical protein